MNYQGTYRQVNKISGVAGAPRRLILVRSWNTKIFGEVGKMSTTWHCCAITFCQVGIAFGELLENDKLKGDGGEQARSYHAVYAPRRHTAREVIFLLFLFFMFFIFIFTYFYLIAFLHEQPAGQGWSGSSRQLWSLLLEALWAPRPFEKAQQGLRTP